MRNTGYSKYQKNICLLGDIVLLNIAFVVAYIIRFNHFAKLNDYEIIILLIYNFSWWIIITQGKFPIGNRIVQIDKVILNYLKNLLFHGIFIFVTIVVFKLYGLSRLQIVYSFGIEMVLLLSWRIAFYHLLLIYRKSGRNFRTVVILGTDEHAFELYNIVHGNKNYGYKFLGFFEKELNTKSSKEYKVFPLNDFKSFAIENKLDEVFCALPESDSQTISDIMEFCENHLIRLKIVPNFKSYIKKKITVDFIQNIPLILLREEPLESTYASVLKRVFDIAFSLFIIITLLWWFIPLLGLLIRLESKGSVIFKQLRTGKNNKDFYMYKLRSMAVNKDSDKKQATSDDIRFTKVGRFIRKTSIDELPQFFNVLKGEMSIVGPRPHMLQHTKEYSEIISKYMVRHFVKPGITGWAQICGFRGSTNDPELMRKRVEHDVWYLENWSFVLDLTIIIKTMINAVKGEKNAY